MFPIFFPEQNEILMHRIHARLFRIPAMTRPRSGTPVVGRHGSTRIRAQSVAIWLAVTTLVVSRGFADQPNILLIYSDDHASQAISACGSRINTTPQIDRLATEGMRFDRCLVTNSICGPCRAVILTGKYSHLNGFRQNGNVFDNTQTTFPGLLQTAGYQTALFGKWHLGCEPTGFDDWLVLPGQGRYYNPDFKSPAGKLRVEGYVTDIVTDRAIQWLDQNRNDDQPFMLMVQHKAPHREWSPGPAHLNSFRDGEIIEPATLMDDYSGRSPVVAEQTMTIARHMRDGWDLKLWRESDRDTKPWNNFFARFSEQQRADWVAAYGAENQAFLENPPEGKELIRWKYQRYVRDYLRCIQSVDDNVGRLLDYLDDNDLARNTVVIYSSDQGFYLGEHGWYDKRWIFEESLTTPLLIRWPGVTAAGSTCDRMVSNLDFAETFLDMAGVDIPADMQGRSMVPLLRSESVDDWRSDFYYHYYELGTHNVAAHYGLVTDQHKLVHYYRRLDDEKQPQSIDQWDLLDRRADPRELVSFADAPEYADVRRELAERLVQLRQELQVPEEE